MLGWGNQDAVATIRLIVAIDDFTDAVADARYEAGFDDAHLAKSGGRSCIILDDRDTTDLENAVRRAIADAHRAGVRVLRVEVPAVEDINAELAADSSS
jgi:molybdopterin/thiamine biosynthesis adenylyltransferase